MKIAFIVRSTFYSSFGGDTVQTLSTAKYLRNLGVEVDIKLTHETIHYKLYDLLHFFNIIRPDDILKHITNSGLPFVVSSVYVDYRFYANPGNSKAYPVLFRLMDADKIEFIKRLGRTLFNGEIMPSFEYLKTGHKKSIEKILNKCSAVLPNSENEYNRLKKSYSFHCNYSVIPNGIDKQTFKQPSDAKKDPLLVICVGRVELRKNQLSLIKALNNTEFKLLIVGMASPNHKGYLEKCKSIAASNVEFRENISQEELIELYSRAKVHVLPSWFETTGLASLEAAYMKCNPVITDKGDTRDYFGDEAFYCNPQDPESILVAVREAASSEFPENLAFRINNSFTWEITANKTLEVYHSIIEAA